MKTRVMIALLLSMLVTWIGLTGAAPVRAAEQSVNARQSCNTAQPLAANVHRAGLVVTFGDRPTARFCVEFTEDTISGLQLLERAASPESGLQPIVTYGGAAVCAIGGVGSTDASSSSACFGQYPNYWAYYHFVNGAWTYSQKGASQYMIRDGDIDGWAWGPGGLSSGAIPAQPGDICPAPTPVPTAAPTATAAPTRPPAPSATAVVPSATDTAVPATVDPGIYLPVASADAPATEVPAPSSAEPDTPAVPGVTPRSAVQAAERSPAPAATTARPSATSIAATPPAGAVVVGAEQGSVNESRAEASRRTAGGSRTSVVVFAGLVVALIAAGAAIVYRRRQLG